MLLSHISRFHRSTEDDREITRWSLYCYILCISLLASYISFLAVLASNSHSTAHPQQTQPLKTLISYHKTKCKCHFKRWPPTLQECYERLPPLPTHLLVDYNRNLSVHRHAKLKSPLLYFSRLCATMQIKRRH